MFKTGDKVVPISKSRGGSWKAWLKKTSTEYLLERGYGIISSMNGKKVIVDGNYFTTDDLLPYQLDKETAFEQLVKGHISSSQYKRITRNTGSEV